MKRALARSLLGLAGASILVTTLVTAGASSVRETVPGRIQVRRTWHSSWIDLGTIADFRSGEILRIGVGGGARQVLIRLLPRGSQPDQPIGLLPEPFGVPDDGVIEVRLQNDHPGVSQISLHGGCCPWDLVDFGPGNGGPVILWVERVRSR